MANAAKVQTALKLSQEDQNTIASLKREIEKAWKMVDAAHEKEGRAKETIQQLKHEIQNLSRLVEQGAGLSVGQESTVNELLKLRSELQKERDAQAVQIAHLKAEVADYLAKMRALETEAAHTAGEVDKLRDVIAEKKADSEKELKIKQRLEKEARHARHATLATLAMPCHATPATPRHAAPRRAAPRHARRATLATPRRAAPRPLTRPAPAPPVSPAPPAPSGGGDARAARQPAGGHQGEAGSPGQVDGRRGAAGGAAARRDDTHAPHRTHAHPRTRTRRHAHARADAHARARAHARTHLPTHPYIRCCCATSADGRTRLSRRRRCCCRRPSSYSARRTTRRAAGCHGAVATCVLEAATMCTHAATMCMQAHGVSGLAAEHAQRKNELGLRCDELAANKLEVARQLKMTENYTKKCQKSNDRVATAEAAREVAKARNVELEGQLASVRAERETTRKALDVQLRERDIENKHLVKASSLPPLPPSLAPFPCLYPIKTFLFKIQSVKIPLRVYFLFLLCISSTYTYFVLSICQFQIERGGSQFF